MNTEHETISALRVDLYDCPTQPSDILKAEWPSAAKRYAWIPQTIADQIWVVFDFPTVESRIAWEATLSERLTKWLDRELIPHALSFGWAVRDWNGFPR